MPEHAHPASHPDRRNTSIRLLLFDDNPLTSLGFRALVKETALVCGRALELIGEVSSLDAARRMTHDRQPDAVLVQAHVDYPEISQVITLLAENQSAPVLLMTDKVNPRARQAVAAGAHGVLLSRATPDQLAAAISLAVSGYVLLAPRSPAAPYPFPITGTASPAEAPPRPDSESALREDTPEAALTSREREILELMARGWSNAELSRALSLSENTVKTHVHRVLNKLGLRNRVHALIYAYESGLVGVRLPR